MHDAGCTTQNRDCAVAWLHAQFAAADLLTTHDRAELRR
jgi:hypothetical protein